MNKIIVILIVVLTFAGCTKDNFVDTGKASGVFAGSMLEYMRSHPVDWDLTVEVIEYAGLTDLFDGKDPNNKEITFIGPTKLSIMRYMLSKDIKKVTDRPAEEWKQKILDHVIKGKYMRADITRGNSNDGGDVLAGLSGMIIRLYTQADKYGAVPDGGAVMIYAQFPRNSAFKILSGDIEPNNGVVHALSYTYTFAQY